MNESVNDTAALCDKIETMSTSEASQMSAADDFAAHFADLKKKKKKVKAEPLIDDEGFKNAPNASNASTVDGTETGRADSGSAPGTLHQGVGALYRDQSYAKLLTRIFNILRLQNPDLTGGRKKYTIVPPSIHREGNKKTLFANIMDICKRMNRDSHHVIQFLFTELGTTGSTDASSRLIIKGRFQQKQIETILKRYIVEYVTCKTCKSPNTLLNRENRLFFQLCESCGSSRSVSAIKSGFKAQTEKRSALRNKEA